MQSRIADPAQGNIPEAGNWCCVQSGHRERYAIPRALHRAGLLDRLLTDLWVPPGGIVSGLCQGGIGRRMRDRYHPDLPRAKVTACSLRALAWETRARFAGLRGDRLVLTHNEWWAQKAAAMLRRHACSGATHVFSYCYEALPLFHAAGERRLLRVLGQIDPGPVEDEKVAGLVRRWPDFTTGFRPGPPEYYRSWREECALADHILVNSGWSRVALLQAGIEAEKITVCPLVHTPPPEARGWNRPSPAGFSQQRPLRVLFLGQCILRKGIAETIEAAQALRDEPVEFTFVGNTDIADFSAHFGRARIRHVPRVSRAECHAFYRTADVFLFPTHSDGFGLTQLEAQAWRLPIIASRFCAEVVRDGETGWIIPEVSGAEIARVIRGILAAPESLAHCARRIEPWAFGLEQLAGALNSLSPRLSPVP